MRDYPDQTLLPRIDGPGQLKSLTLPQLQQLAQEIRDTIICTVARNGGHLAPNLGVVELTLALHFVFEAPIDRIIWDVGHQAYAHKLLTGRQSQFHTIRQYGGISGFPKRSESKFDAFGTGHSSTSISAALGITVANSLKGVPQRAIAVIGDGSMTGGLAFEALNHAGDLNRNLIVVLNDNEMSISPNVGALSSFLSRKLSNRTLMNLKKEVENVLRSIPSLGPNIIQILKRSEDSLVSFFTPGMLFQALDFHYIGPIKGHRLDRLIETFERARQLEGPVLVHVMTQKGRGYKPAECDPTSFHGVGSFDIATGKSCGSNSGKPCPPSYTQVFGQTMVRLGQENPRVIGITAAMPQGTGLDTFASAFPDRFFDVGIAEQHAVTFAAGLACEGIRPVVAIYSTFLQRAFDCIVHDVALQDLPVIFCMDRAGLSCNDGPTHHGLFDIAYLRCVPNVICMAPKDEDELVDMMFTATHQPHPTFIRYPRGAGEGVPIKDQPRLLEIGKAEVVQNFAPAGGRKVALFGLGNLNRLARETAERLQADGCNCAVINPRFTKPLDTGTTEFYARAADVVVTFEDHTLVGGYGSSVLELLSERGISTPVVRIGWPDQFIEHASTVDYLRRKYGLSVDNAVAQVRALLGTEPAAAPARTLAGVA